MNRIDDKMGGASRDLTRKEFLAGASLFLAEAGLGVQGSVAQTDEIRGVLLHMGMGMWGDWRAPDEPTCDGVRYVADHVRFSEKVWRGIVNHAKARGFNMVIMDLGEFVRYPRRPELAVTGSWSAERLNAEVRRLREMGLEPIPKVNFSTCHDSWLKQYHRMVSTRAYYQVCSDVLKDVRDIFETPRFVHIGFDEESVEHQKRNPFVVARQGDLWYHDLNWFVRGVEKLGMRAWMFSDYGWRHPEFVKRCPKSVLQSNWYYNEDLEGYDLAKMKDWFKPHLQLFRDLSDAGFEQVPVPSNWLSPKQTKAGWKDNAACAGELVKFCRANIEPSLLKGFVMAPWGTCESDDQIAYNNAGIDQLADAM